MNKGKILISISLNSVILGFTIIALGLSVIDAPEQGLEYWELFKFFTILSNLFLFIMAAVMITYQSLYLNKRIKQIPKWVTISKLCATTTTTITMLVVLVFLLPLSFVLNPESFDPPIHPHVLFKGSNAFLHLLTPLTGIIVFVLFEETKGIKLPELSYSLIFVALYEIIYVTNIYHKFIPGKSDWYLFRNGHDYMVPIMVILFLGGAFLFAWLLWFINRKIHLWEKAA